LNDFFTNKRTGLQVKMQQDGKNKRQRNLLLQLSKNKNKLECGPMPNVMVALPNIGGALCSTPQFG